MDRPRGSAVQGPSLPREPDYEQLTPLQPSEGDTAPLLTPLLILGVGPLGRAVLESLASDLHGLRSVESCAVRLLAVELRDAPALDYALPAVDETALLPHEQLVLDYRPGVGAPAWYASGRGDEWSRADGRLGVCQGLRGEPPALWQALQDRMDRGDRPDVWVVGSAFDSAGGGMAFDVAHAARLVGEAQNYEPLLAWMLALPSDDWGDPHQHEAAATLRELGRLLHYDLPRVYEYGLSSTNYLLHRRWSSGRDDANVVMLCEPPSEVYGTAAAEIVVERMALALLASAQPGVWGAFQDDLRAMTAQLRTERSALISSFGVQAQVVPLQELQDLVRCRLAHDLLVDRQAGLLSPWRPRRIEPDIDAATLLLRQAGHRFLAALADGLGSLSQRSSWPAHGGAAGALALTLRQALQERVDRAREGCGLEACDELLAGVEEVLLRTRAPREGIEPVEAMVGSARRALHAWLGQRDALQRTIESARSRAQRRWERVLSRPAWHCVVEPDAPQEIYAAMTAGDADVRARMRRYVRWAWVMDGDALQPRLDVLYPGWDMRREDWRHGVRPAERDRLWDQVRRVVEALTRESNYWPTFLVGPGTVLPSGETVEEAIRTSLAQEAIAPRRCAYQASGDRAWGGRRWFPPGVSVANAAAYRPTLGILWQVYHLIPLESVVSLAVLVRRYRQRQDRAIGLHIFEAERLASEIESAAWGRLSRRERDSAGAVRLGARTVATLQAPQIVRWFVRAWLDGHVKPAFGPGPYRVVDTSLPSHVLEGAGSIRANHPLEALHVLVLPLLDRPQAFGPQSVQSIESAPGSDRLQELSEWWSSPEPRTAEWYLLVHGLIEGRQS